MSRVIDPHAQHARRRELAREAEQRVVVLDVSRAPFLAEYLVRRLLPYVGRAATREGGESR